MKKVVITGATSMLGVALVNECINKGIEVLAIIRENSKNIGRLPKSDLINILSLNLEDFSSFDLNSTSLTSDYEVFYHFAWDFTFKEKRNNPKFQNVNVNYAIDAVKLAKEFGCSKFIGAGSQAEYGRVSNIISPDTSVNPDIAYGVAKYAANKLTKIECENLGITHIWVRIFSVYGPNDMDNTMISYALSKLLNSEKPSFTPSEQLWDYLYCKDAAIAFRLIGEKVNKEAVYCLGSGEMCSLKDYIYKIRNAIDKNLELGIGDIPYSKNQVMNLCADISKLTEDTGFEPKFTFEEGIQETIEWFKNEKVI